MERSSISHRNTCFSVCVCSNSFSSVAIRSLRVFVRPRGAQYTTGWCISLCHTTWSKMIHADPHAILTTVLLYIGSISRLFCPSQYAPLGRPAGCAVDGYKTTGHVAAVVCVGWGEPVGCVAELKSDRSKVAVHRRKPNQGIDTEIRRCAV